MSRDNRVAGIFFRVALYVSCLMPPTFRTTRFSESILIRFIATAADAATVAAMTHTQCEEAVLVFVSRGEQAVPHPPAPYKGFT